MSKLLGNDTNLNYFRQIIYEPNIKAMKDLKRTAAELNEVMGLDPAIPTTGIRKRDLLKKILEAGKLIHPMNDEFTPETIQLLKKMHIWPETTKD